MSQNSAPLTAAKLAALACGPGERLVVRDGIIPGLRVRVGERSKTFVLTYRAGARQRAFTLGNYPVMSLSEAREMAREVLARARIERFDPQTRAMEQRESPLFAALARQYVAARAPYLAARTRAEYERMVAAYIAPHATGKLQTNELRRPHLRELLEDLAQRRGPVIANRVFQLVRAVCRWGVRTDAPIRRGEREVRPLLDMNPADGLQRPRPEKTKERTLSDREVVALWHAAAAAPGAVAAYTRCLLLLGQRADETLSMRWDNLDLERGLWEIPGEFRKGGRSHAVPLPHLVVELLRGLPQAGPRVFPLDRHNWVRWWEPLRAAAVAGGAEHFTRHDLRRTCATGCARLGASSELVSRILGHKAVQGTIAVTAVYDRYDRLEERRAALEKWARHVAAICTVPTEH